MAATCEDNEVMPPYAEGGIRVQRIGLFLHSHCGVGEMHTNEVLHLGRGPSAVNEDPLGSGQG